MVGEFVCMYVCSCTVSEWVMWVWCVWVRDVRVSEVSGVEWSEVKWSEWVSEWVGEWVSAVGEVGEVGEWVSEGGSEWVSVCVWVSEWVSVVTWESIHPSIDRWVCVCVTESVSEWVSKWVSEWVLVSESERVRECEWVSVREWVEWESEWLSERLPRKRGGAQGTPGRTPTPWQCTLSHACHAKEAEPKGRQGVHPTPWQCTLIVPRLPRKMHIVSRLPRKRSGDPRDARAYIRPLGSAHCATPATQKRRRPKGRQGVHPTPWQCTLCHACHAKEAEPKVRQGVLQPLGSAHCPTPATQKRRSPRDARAYIRPLGSAHCPTPATQNAHCLTPATQKKRRPKGRQGVHPTPWQCTLCHACHAKEAETQGTPGRTSDPLAVHIVPRLPRKRGGDPRDARAYIRPLGSAHCATPATQKRRRPKGRQGVHPTRKRGGDPRDARAYIRPLGSAHCATPATQKRRRPKGRQGVHPTPWQCTLCHACRRQRTFFRLLLFCMFIFFWGLFSIV